MVLYLPWWVISKYQVISPFILSRNMNYLYPLIMITLLTTMLSIVRDGSLIKLAIDMNRICVPVIVQRRQNELSCVCSVNFWMEMNRIPATSWGGPRRRPKQKKKKKKKKKDECHVCMPTFFWYDNDLFSWRRPYDQNARDRPDLTPAKRPSTGHLVRRTWTNSWTCPCSCRKCPQ